MRHSETSSYKHEDLCQISKCSVILKDLFKKNKWHPEEDSLNLHKWLIYLNNIIMISDDAPKYIFGLCYAIDNHALLGSGPVKGLA